MYFLEIGLSSLYLLQQCSKTCLSQFDDRSDGRADFFLLLLGEVETRLDFEPESFDHLAFYDASRQRIEMHLVSKTSQRVHCLDEVIEFDAGERIHTEYSYKYTVDGFSELAGEAGYQARAHWTDQRDWFAVQYLEAA